MLSILIITAFSFKVDSTHEKAFIEFMKQYGYKFVGIEYLHRLTIFSQRLTFIEEYNRNSNNVKLGINQYSHLSKQERKFRFGVNHSIDGPNRIKRGKEYKGSGRVLSYPDNYDMRDAGVVPGVRDQGTSCLACTAFACSAMVEIRYYQMEQSSATDHISVQLYIDCIEYNLCTQGSTVEHVLYGQDNVWNTQWFDWQRPYLASFDVDRCDINYWPPCYWEYPDDIYTVANNESLIKEVLYDNGSLAVEVDSSPETFLDYSSGIYNDTSCNSAVANHAMCLVGYGVSSNVNYWILKNSWGTSWGLSGYMTLIRGYNRCGIRNEVWYVKLRYPWW